MIETIRNDLVPQEHVSRYRIATSEDLRKVVELGNRGFGVAIQDLATRRMYYLVPLIMPPFSLTALCGEPTFTAFDGLSRLTMHGRIRCDESSHLFEVRGGSRGEWQSLFRAVQTSLCIFR